MEEILASIRRIIADDDASKTVARAPEPQPESRQRRHRPPPIARAAPVLCARAALRSGTAL